MVVAHATVPSLIAALGCPPPAGGSERRPLVTAATRCEALAYRRHIRRPRAVRLRPTGPVGSPRGGTPRAWVRSPPCSPCVLTGPALRPCRPRERNYTIDDASHGIHTDPLHARRAPAAKHIRRGPPGATSGRDGRCARPERGARRTRPAVCAPAPRGVAGTSGTRASAGSAGGRAGPRPPIRRGRFGSSFLRITRAAWPARDCGRGGRRVAAR